MESREDLEDWQECLSKALGRPASIIRDDDDAQDNGACAGELLRVFCFVVCMSKNDKEIVTCYV